MHDLLASDDHDKQELIQRLAKDRQGYRLATCVPVGLPVFKLTVTCVILARKSIPPIEEFVLRAVEAGITSVTDLAGFLGLELSLVTETLVRLQQSEDIDVRQRVAHLTVRGRSSLLEAARVNPEEKTLDIYFDGLTRECFPYSPSLLLSSRQAEGFGIDEIPPVPTKAPDLGELSRDTVSKYIRSAVGLRDLGIDLLEIRRLERRERLHLPALALVYKGLNSSDVEIGFLLDEQLSISHETAFCKSKSAKRRLIVEQVLAPPIISTELEQLHPSETTNSETIASAEIEIVDTETKMVFATQSSEPARAMHLPTAVHYTEKFLDCYDHPPLLRKALRESKTRLLIISPWITTEVVDREFLRALENRLDSGTRVIIGFGFKENKPRPVEARNAEKSLVDLKNRYRPIFSFVNYGNTHAKVLLSDHSFVIKTSFNWLSFRGERRRTYRDEQGIMLTNPVKIEEAYARALKLLRLDR